MMIGGPLFVDALGDAYDAGAAPAHVLDDRRGVMHEHVRVVDLFLDFVEDKRRGGHRVVEPRGINRNLLFRAKPGVALALKGGSRVDEGEIDVEKDRASLHATAASG